jgi:hypothetical protein
MAVTRAADDFTNIRARMDELRRERMPVIDERAVEQIRIIGRAVGRAAECSGSSDRHGIVEVIIVEL